MNGCRSAHHLELSDSSSPTRVEKFRDVSGRTFQHLNGKIFRCDKSPKAKEITVMTKSETRICFIRELLFSRTHNYTNNYDYHRFGKHHLRLKVRELVKGILHKNGLY